MYSTASKNEKKLKQRLQFTCTHHYANNTLQKGDKVSVGKLNMFIAVQNTVVLLCSARPSRERLEDSHLQISYKATQKLD